MNPVVPAYDLAPVAGVIAVGLALALGPLVWFWFKRRGASPAARLRALALMTLFLSFDLVLFGAFTRLSDSGLGCPDWPGCYGQASPVGAREPIASAEAAVPTGAVTHTKAWIEMAHRYSATAIGVLVVVLAAIAVVESRRKRVRATPVWAIATVLWIIAQGAFGALTVTMSLYPAIVTLHLLGGLGLLALLAIQAEAYEPRPLPLSPTLRFGVAAVAVLALVQIALGGWVSTNYAVLACRELPTCQGAWWPDMDFAAGFVLLRPLGGTGDGAFLPFAALTAIHVAHRLGAMVVLAAIALLAWRLLASGGPVAARPWGWALAGIALWQALSGLGNVLLGWPLVLAVAHTAGSAALVVVLTILLARSSGSPRQSIAAWPTARRHLAS
ncbi:MAG TPA: COX15/CtaA family protein [Caldimonas sp.]|nr:COX15/CtaA family protein [Caldimonas sp.]